MEVVAAMLMAVVAVVAMAAGSSGASLMLPSYNWTDCGDTTSNFRVTKLNVTAPLTIPGQLTIRELEATLTGSLPADALIQFYVNATSTFGVKKIVPCFEHQGGSCAYGLCDMLTLSDTSSRVTQQVVKALRDKGVIPPCPLSAPQTVTLRDVTIDVPSMLHTEMDLFVNTNNYFVTMKLVSANSDTEFGCVEVDMPVYKPCHGWLCMKNIDYINKIMNP